MIGLFILTGLVLVVTVGAIYFVNTQIDKQNNWIQEQINKINRKY